MREDLEKIQIVVQDADVLDHSSLQKKRRCSGTTCVEKRFEDTFEARPGIILKMAQSETVFAFQ